MSTTKLKCVVIDDSKIQRLAVSNLVKNHKKLQLIAEYEDAKSAQSGLKDIHIDLIFLDLEMPVLNGFEFIELLENRPQIILITSNPEYAMRAFDYDVIDYLLKPIPTGRFDQAIKKAFAKNTDIPQVSDDDFVFVSSKLKKIKILLSDIKWIEGLGDYLKIITTEDKGILVLSTMKSFMQKLPDDKFLRIHKSYIVNLDKVDRFSGSQVEVCGQNIPLSRYKKTQLEEALLKSSNK